MKLQKRIKNLLKKIFDFVVGLIMLTVTIEGIKAVIFGLNIININ